MFEHRISAGFRAYFGYQSIQAQGPTAKVWLVLWLFTEIGLRKLCGRQD
jgi:hypothetical protein